MKNRFSLFMVLVLCAAGAVAKAPKPPKRHQPGYHPHHHVNVKALEKKLAAKIHESPAAAKEEGAEFAATLKKHAHNRGQEPHASGPGVSFSSPQFMAALKQPAGSHLPFKILSISLEELSKHKTAGKKKKKTFVNLGKLKHFFQKHPGVILEVHFSGTAIPHFPVPSTVHFLALKGPKVTSIGDYVLAHSEVRVLYVDGINPAHVGRGFGFESHIVQMDGMQHWTVLKNVDHSATFLMSDQDDSGRQYVLSDKKPVHTASPKSHAPSHASGKKKKRAH